MSELLTDRERAVLEAYAELGSYSAVGQRLGITRATVSQTLANVRSKLQVDKTAQAVWIHARKPAA